MKFIVDAQLPYRLKFWLIENGFDAIQLIENGFDAIHTRDLPNANKTDDLHIIEVAEKENLAVISKDSDFLKLHVLSGKPQKLLLITTGNIVNKDLLKIC